MKMKGAKIMITLKNTEIKATSMVTADDRQLLTIKAECSRTSHLFMTISDKGRVLAENIPIALSSGKTKTTMLLPASGKDFSATAAFFDKCHNKVCETEFVWKKPREWEIFVMLSSHTDIGLHNSQYIQRANSVKFIDMASELCDKTDNEEAKNKYRYTVEGTWWWKNYTMDRETQKAREVSEKYIKTGDIGVCCGFAGNHIQTYGLEEMCRSTYERKKLSDEWGIKSETLAMIDNNGMPVSMIQPYVNAGYKNIIFAPNQWNPLPSTVWHTDTSGSSFRWNPQYGGGGARIDVSYNSELPMVFWWEDKDGHRLLVWASTQYEYGCEIFGLTDKESRNEYTVPVMEDKISDILPTMEEKYPYDIWLAACYNDDRVPDMGITEIIKEWNGKWKSPVFRTLGNPDKPFELLREKYYNDIPVLKGDITGGWYQHPVAAADILSKKSETDRLLPNAEKWAVTAALLNDEYKYPKIEFDRAWECLLCNDEHSYGTSSYKGRRVYETWLQHRDWINKAYTTAKNELSAATAAIAAKIPSDTDKTVAFNPTLLERRELLETEDGYMLVSVPPMGYTAVEKENFIKKENTAKKTKDIPIIENAYYRVQFSENGAITSVYDKELCKEFLDKNCEYRANELVYTQDNHKSFSVTEKAEFEAFTDSLKTVVTVRTRHNTLGCELVCTITLPCFEKRIDIDNRIYHARAMINDSKYYRYIYFAFPFMIENSHRYCGINGGVTKYAEDVTGHGTDTYMAASEWCCCENDNMGAALLMLDSQLIEFDHIHPDKTDFGNAGNGSQIFVYAANDWLQRHCSGGSHLDFRFRFSIISYKGGYEEAKIPQTSERYANPISTVKISAQNGFLDSESQSLFTANTGARFLCLKKAEDGDGVIARFYGDNTTVSFDKLAGKSVTAQANTIDERNDETRASTGFFTYRLRGGGISVPERNAAKIITDKKAPLPIGSVYTGLIDKPCACAGENFGEMYILWGNSTDADLSHYSLYRSEYKGFTADGSTFIANIQPSEYVVERYDDAELKTNTRYYYKICAVNKQGICGALSDEFSAVTKEELK